MAYLIIFLISSCVQQSAGKHLSSLFVIWGITCLENFDAMSDYNTLQIGVPCEKECNR